MVQRFGLTWWGKRWISSLELLGAQYESRLPRGRTYARKGTVHDVEIQSGHVTALVDGSRARPYGVRIQLDHFDDDTWEEVVEALAGELRHAAELLDGRMPEDVDDTLSGVGVSLFPTVRELQTACSCPDWANPCKHIAAVHYVLATRFDEDPFLLMRLRGRDRDELLTALRAHRADGAVAADASPVEVTSIPLGAIVAATLFDEGAAADVDIAPQQVDVLAVLRRLGPLPGRLEDSHAEVADAVQRAADAAWHLLTGREEPQADVQGP